MPDDEIRLQASFQRHHQFADKDNPLSITVDTHRIKLYFDRQRDAESISLTDSEWEKAVELVNDMRRRRDAAVAAVEPADA